MTIYHILGMAGVIMLIIGVSLYSGRKVANAADFATGGGKAGSLLVLGAIMGSLVSSQATIGTAQLAFHFGISAWWFTLGSGLGCIILALFYVKPLRESGCVTELSIISQEYGKKAGEIGSALCSIGIFISVLAQIVACAGLITVIFPSIDMIFAIAISVAITAIYVIFGGAWGAGLGGVVKLILLSLASMGSFLLIYIISGGGSELISLLENNFLLTKLGQVQSAVGLKEISTSGDFSARFLSFVARGPLKDIGSAFSLLLGVLSTQTYAQAVISGQSHSAAKKGALLSAFLIPPLGLAGVVIGLYMRAHYLLPGEIAALSAIGDTALLEKFGTLSTTIQAFPAFAMNHLPPVAAGVVIGTLFISVVGGGAGLTLGVATIIVNDIGKKISPKLTDSAAALKATRLTILAVLLLAGIIGAFVPGATINDLGFLSMGLRGSVVFIPLTCALFWPNQFSCRWMFYSIILGPVAVLLSHFLSLPGDPLFYGMAASFICAAIGKKRH